jgi:outer membrane protein OmpA-like peptidoglycan-associated protein
MGFSKQIVVLGAAVSVLVIVWVLTPAAAAENCAKARELYKQGTGLLNYEQRRAVFGRAVELCPSYAEAHVNLADAYENLAKMSKGSVKKFNRLLDMAADEYQQAIRYRPGIFAAYLGLGDTLRVMGLYERSEGAYRRALQLRPGNAEALTGLKKIRTIKSLERAGLKRSNEIIAHYRASSRDTGAGTLMGFADETVVKDRLRFNNILFDEWSPRLTRAEALRQLEEVGKALSDPELADSAFVVEGHTDNRGGLDRNMKLSWDRAEAVKGYLIDKFNVDPSRITTQGLGYSRPRFPNDSRDHMLKNRRVELLFIDRGTGN